MVTDTELEKLEEELQQTDDSDETPPSDIVAFNELRSCADLLRMHQNHQLTIQPEFQRDVIWSNAMQTRFVDSLVKQLPIPSMCISLDYKTQERLVIDGLQRISSIIFFLSERDEWILSGLADIDSRISGQSNFSIRKKHPMIIEKVENTTIPITVLRCDYKKKNHMTYLFTIFHRLNTGGNKLTNQEIRNCIYNGPFNSFLRSSVNSSNFRSLFLLETGRSYRFAYEELVLRFVAFAEKFEKYRGKLATFLNDYMESKRLLNSNDLLTVETNFNDVINIFIRLNNTKKVVHRLSKAACEALYVGISRNISHLRGESVSQLDKRFESLLSDPLFSVDSLKGGLSNRDSVINRISRAINIFS